MISPTTTENDFERELTLQDLLRGIDSSRLLAALQTLLDAPAAIIDPDGSLLAGEPLAPAAPSAALCGELETIGKLAANVPPAKIQAAAKMVELLLRANARYLMAADLHIQTQRTDFEELQRRHDALEKSEQRYKALAETLEQRVKQQVKTIESAQLKLYESEKLASVGRLAAGIAHEINNPIGFIRSNLSTAASYVESLHRIGSLIASGADAVALQNAWREEDMDFLQQDLRDIFEESIAGADRIAAIIKDLKSFSRIDEGGEENADINQILMQVCRVAAAELHGKIEVVLDLGEIPPVRCHPGDLGQAFLSLLINAIDAITGAGKIQIRTCLKAGHICIDVRDSGCGIPESALPNVFEPFFTTKDIGKGVGLGLTVCRNIIQAHNGSLAIKSKPGVGTLVSIVLPLRPLHSS
ncbi:MAG: sensor histidine kinase [Methylomonas sp.]